MAFTKRIYAYCDHSGAIQFGHRTPGQRIPIAFGEDSCVREKITQTAEQDKGQLFVPGMRKAVELGQAAERYQALARYIQHIDQFSGSGLRAIGA